MGSINTLFLRVFFLRNTLVECLGHEKKNARGGAAHRVFREESPVFSEEPTKSPFCADFQQKLEAKLLQKS